VRISLKSISRFGESDRAFRGISITSSERSDDQL